MAPPYILYPNGTRREGEVIPASAMLEPVPPGDLAFIRIDHQARLQFDDLEVVIESTFSLESAGSHYLRYGIPKP